MRAFLGFLFPVILALVAFGLSLLSSLAGAKAGFMPDSNMALLDTSRMGLDAVLSGNNAPSIVRSSLSMGSGKINNEKNKLINGTKDEVAKSIKDAVGLDQFYAVHAWTICSGTFTNKQDSSGGLEVRVCWPLHQINLIDLLEMDLKLSGPVQEAIREVGGAAPRIPTGLNAAWLGMRVEVGSRFQGMAWAATALMGVASLYHVLAVILASHNRSSKSRI
ncbi:hypothetical protein PspLS_04712 [Pyricularia sp. CBS 133598]|nr:hypothetical protein PspLS_04712 [Pyricularia sp. CBS 133598]